MKRKQRMLQKLKDAAANETDEDVLDDINRVEPHTVNNEAWDFEEKA